VRNKATVLDQSFETQPKEPKTVRMSGPVDVLQTYFSLRVIDSMLAS
jgi:hypothetical protein